MNVVIITLTKSQIDHLPNSHIFATKFKGAISENIHRTYEVLDNTAAMKLCVDILRYNKYYKITDEANNVLKIEYLDTNTAIYIDGTTIKVITQPETHQNTTLQCTVENNAELQDDFVTLTVEREIAVEYLQFLVSDKDLRKYDYQVLKILIDVLIQSNALPSVSL